MSPAETNRENAQHSTGPKTQEGKHRSSLNALRHGLTSQIVVMPGEDLAAYQKHLKSFTDEYHPQGASEQQLVQSLADTSWRMNRIAALETNILTISVAHEPDPLKAAIALASNFESQAKAIASLSLHSQRLSRQFERTINQLRELQKARMETLLDTIEAYQAKGRAFDPAEHGFVFSAPQIAAATHLRTRQNRPRNAA